LAAQLTDVDGISLDDRNTHHARQLEPFDRNLTGRVLVAFRDDDVGDEHHALDAARHGHPSALLRGGRRAHAGAMWARDDPVGSLLLACDAATLPVRRRIGGLRTAS